MRLRKPAVLTLAASLLLLTAQAGHAVTIATFADPSPGFPPVFVVDQKANTISGVWLGTGLTLETRIGTYNDVQFTMPPISMDARAVTGAGLIEFRETDTDLILRITFDQAQLDHPFSFGATEFMGLSEVAFSGPAVDPPGVIDGTETFSFPFANQTATPTGYTATAAFTSSGDLVPEPSSLAGLALLTMLAARRRAR